MNCRHLSPRGWRHHLPRQRGHWVCDLGRGVVKPCGPLCNERCDQYQEPGTTGPQEDATMAGKGVRWDAPAGETVTGAPRDVTLAEWAEREIETGTRGTKARLADLLGITATSLSTRLARVPAQAAAPVEAEFYLEDFNLEALKAYLRDEDLYHDATVFCRGWNARGREVA